MSAPISPERASSFPLGASVIDPAQDKVGRTKTGSAGPRLRLGLPGQTSPSHQGRFEAELTGDRPFKSILGELRLQWLVRERGAGARKPHYSATGTFSRLKEGRKHPIAPRIMAEATG
jgi:hypothetical protein